MDPTRAHFGGAVYNVADVAEMELGPGVGLWKGYVQRVKVTQVKVPRQRNLRFSAPYKTAAQ